MLVLDRQEGDTHQPEVLGTLIRNGGGEQLLIPQDQIDRIEALGGDDPPTCLHCDGPLEPRRHGGGKPKLFCSDKCRSAHHAGCAPPSNPTVNPPSNAPSLPMDLPTVETPKQAMPKDDDGCHDFDWHAEADAEDIVLAEQRRTAIYWGKHGDMIIRQQCPYDDEDACIYINEQNARAFALKLCEFLEIEVKRD